MSILQAMPLVVLGCVAVLILFALACWAADTWWQRREVTQRRLFEDHRPRCRVKL